MLLGEALRDICASAEEELVLCAPFAKAHVLERLLAATPESLDLTLITRWRAEEVAAGVSDVAVLSLMAERGGRVLLHDRLHAKYFRNESRVLLGSANLTGTALGWTLPRNLELLVPAERSQVADLESLLLVEATTATADLADEIQALAAALGLKPAIPVEVELGDSDPPSTWGEWWPALRHPSDLFRAYQRGTDTLTTSAGFAARADLAWLDLPAGLQSESFQSLVGSRLLQHPLVNELDQFLESRQRFGAVRDFVAARRGIPNDEADVAWQTLMRWLLEFLPTRYNVSTPRWSEVIQRATAQEESP